MVLGNKKKVLPRDRVTKQKLIVRMVSCAFFNDERRWAARDQGVSRDFVATLLTLSLARDYGNLTFLFFSLFFPNFSASFCDNFHRLFKGNKRAISHR